jgi:hypothetical protein
VSPVTIRFSEVFLPQAWPVNYTIDLPFTQGDHVTALIPYGDTLVVMGTAKPAFLIVGIGVLDFDVRPSAGSRAGCFGFRAWDLMAGRIVHASAEGLYLFDGATDTLMTTDLEQDWRELVDVTSEASLARVPVVFHEAEKELRWRCPTSRSTGSRGARVRLGAHGRQRARLSATDRAIGGYIHWNGPEQSHRQSRAVVQLGLDRGAAAGREHRHVGRWGGPDREISRPRLRDASADDPLSQSLCRTLPRRGHVHAQCPRR